MTLKNNIRLRLLLLTILGFFKTIFLLSAPFILATASIWIKWLITILPNDISNWVTNSSEGLVSTFNVLAGAYLTLYATYALKKNEERQKSIASKELVFYIPMFDEIVQAIEYKRKEKLWKFDLQDSGYLRRTKWIFWNETQNSLLKYNVPQVFAEKLCELDTNINQYMKKYSEVSLFCSDLAKKMTSNAGLVDSHFKGGYYNILDEIYLDTFSNKSVSDSVPNCKEIIIDCEKLSQDIRCEILDSKEYTDFVQSFNRVSKLMDEVYEGLDYILMKIHKKYKGMNTLL